MKYLSFDDFEVDIVRAIYNLSNKYSINVFVGGHSQSGKTTLVWYICNRIIQLRKYGYRALDPFASCNRYDEWNGYENSATNAMDFVKLWNQNSNGVLTLSEASTSMFYMDWMNIMSRVFTSSTTVLGKNRNICFIDTVFESEIMKKAREKMDFRIELHRRDDYNMKANVRSGWTLIDYLGMKWMLIRYNEWNVQYNKRILLRSKQYTDWISKTVKADEAIRNEQRVGIRPQYKIYFDIKSGDRVHELPFKQRNL